MNQHVSGAVRHGCIALSRAYRNGARSPRLKPWAIAVSSLTGPQASGAQPITYLPYLVLVRGFVYVPSRNSSNQFSTTRMAGDRAPPETLQTSFAAGES